MRHTFLCAEKRLSVKQSILPLALNLMDIKKSLTTALLLVRTLKSGQRCFKTWSSEAWSKLNSFWWCCWHSGNGLQRTLFQSNPQRLWSGSGYLRILLWLNKRLKNRSTRKIYLHKKFDSFINYLSLVTTYKTNILLNQTLNKKIRGELQHRHVIVHLLL